LHLILLTLIVTFVVSGSAHFERAQVASASPLEYQVFSTDSMVVQGEVLCITSVIEEHLIVSYVAILVTQVVIGPDSLRGTEIILKHLGGEVSGVLLWVSDQPYFAVGETVELKVRQEGNLYVSVSPKKTLATPLNVFATAAGYVLMWYKPGTGWQVSTTRPGPDWYGPAKWSTGHFDYWINTANIPSDVSISSFITYATASFQTWQDDPSSSISFTYEGTGTATPGTPDGVNSVGWGSIGGATIAVTTSWGSYSPGDYASLRITETDIKFDSSKAWSAQSSGVSGKYDVQNIGTHEAGHTFGLGDLYDSADSEQTMYGYSSTEETKKRTLEWGDQAGAAALYPSGWYTVTFYTDPTSSTITADEVTKTNGDTGTYASGARVHVVANPPNGYQFSYWETSGVSVDSTSSADTYMTVSNNGWLKAHFIVLPDKGALVVFRPSVGTWYYTTKFNSYNDYNAKQWGISGDKPLLGDFDRDGKADLVVYRPSQGSWYWTTSSSSYLDYHLKSWGLANDIPLLGDFDGDGKSDLAVFRPSTGCWYWTTSGSGYSDYNTKPWGLSGDVPLLADMDGDGKADLVVYRPTTGTWWWTTLSSGYSDYNIKQWGLKGDKPLVCDVDGDEKADLTVFRPTNGYWYYTTSSGGYSDYNVKSWGLPGDVPLVGDLDGDGKSDFVVFRANSGCWYYTTSSSGYTSYNMKQWGMKGDIPVLFNAKFCVPTWL